MVEVVDTAHGGLLAYRIGFHSITSKDDIVDGVLIITPLLHVTRGIEYGHRYQVINPICRDKPNVHRIKILSTVKGYKEKIIRNFIPFYIKEVSRIPNVFSFNIRQASRFHVYLESFATNKIKSWISMWHSLDVFVDTAQDAFGYMNPEEKGATSALIHRRTYAPKVLPVVVSPSVLGGFALLRNARLAPRSMPVFVGFVFMEFIDRLNFMAMRALFSRFHSSIACANTLNNLWWCAW